MSFGGSVLTLGLGFVPNFRLRSFVAQALGRSTDTHRACRGLRCLASIEAIRLEYAHHREYYARLRAVQLLLHFVCFTFEEKTCKDLGRGIVRGNECTGASP